MREIESITYKKKKTKIEYPASHSVDTHWFAVDKEGHIASISSSDGGWLPADIEVQEYGGDIPSIDEFDVIGEALLLNSEEICNGCRRLILPDKYLSILNKDYKPEDLFHSKHFITQTFLDGILIKLSENIKFSDLFVWKERINDPKTMIYEISKDHSLLYCYYLRVKIGALKKDIYAGNISEISTFDDRVIYSSYYAVDDWLVNDATMERIEWDYSDTFKFILPNDFYGVKWLDLSFEESDRFDLDDYTGVYALDIEANNLSQQDEDVLIWPNYDGLSKEELIKELFIAINKFRTRSVWCLLDKYQVPPNSIDPLTGETALEQTMRLGEEHDYEKDYFGPGFSCYRIFKMLQLKEKQRVSNQTSST